MIGPELITRDSIPQDLRNFNALEQAVFSAALEAGRRRLISILEQLDEKLAGDCPHCGSPITEPKGKDRRVLKTKLGRVELARRRLFCRACGRSSYPLDERLGLTPGQNVTPALKELALLAAASWPYEAAAEMVGKFTASQLSPAEVEVLAQQEEAVLEEEQQEEIERVWELEVDKESLPTPHRLYVQLDGTFVPSAQAGKESEEGKAALIFSDRLTGVSKGRVKLLEKAYVGSFQCSYEFGRLVYARAYRMGCERAGEVIVMGDGAGWIKGLWELHFPKARFILDWWHLKRRVWEVLGAVIGEEERRTELGQKICDLLWEGELEAALEVIERLAEETGEAEEVKELLGYLGANRAGIGCYRALREAGYYVGTGPVEKAVEAVIVKRQKKQGMKWSRRGAEAIVKLRLKVLNGEWEEYWMWRMSLN